MASAYKVRENPDGWAVIPVGDDVPVAVYQRKDVAEAAAQALDEQDARERC